MSSSNVHARILFVLVFALTFSTVCVRSVVADEAKPLDAEHMQQNVSVWRDVLLDLGAYFCQSWDFARHFVGCSQPPADRHRAILLHVVDPAGKPVAEAVVFLMCVSRDDENAFAKGRWSWDRTSTAADGTVWLARPVAKDIGIVMAVEADGYVSASVQWNQQEKVCEPIPPEFTCKLERSQPIGGVVQDASGQPISGARVVFGLPHADFNRFGLSNTLWHEERTDALGHWQCSHVPPVESLTITISHPDYADLEFSKSESHVLAANLRVLKAVFAMKPGVTVQGRVTNDKGKPVVAAKVEISPANAPGEGTSSHATISTDNDGWYRFANRSPGKNKLSVAARGLVMQHRDIALTPGMPPEDFCLAAGPPVKVRVVDATGKPLAGAGVNLDIPYCDGNQPQITDRWETNDDGRWASVNSPEGKMPLQISKQGYARTDVQFAGSDEEHLVTLQPLFRASGSVVDAITKEPIPKAYVVANHFETGYTIYCSANPSANIDVKGRYELFFDDSFDVKDVMTWQLHVGAPGYTTQLSRKFKTGEGDQTFHFELMRGKAVSGIVKQPDGSPVAGAHVFVSTSANPWTVSNGRVEDSESPTAACERTDADGRFELSRPLEPYVVGVVYESGGAELSAQDLDARGEIILCPWARVEGIIQEPFDPDTEKKIGIILHAGYRQCFETEEHNNWPHVDWDYSAESDESGRFAIERVLPGRIEAYPSCSSFPVIDNDLVDDWRTQILETIGGHTTHVEFIRQGRTVSGRAVLPVGGSRPIALAGGDGCLLFQQPVVPRFTRHHRHVRPSVQRKWEQQWLESTAGQMADRAGQNHVFSVATDGTFKADNVAPGVYNLVVELFDAGGTPDERGNQIGRLTREIVVPASGSPGGKPLELGQFTVELAKLFRGDVAPDFAFKTADGQTHWLAEYRGRNVTLCFSHEWERPLAWMPDANAAKEELLRQEGGGPLVWINLSSDPNARPTVKVTQDAELEYIQGFLEPGSEVMKAYDIRYPRHDPFVHVSRVHVAEDGTFVRR